MGICPLLYEVNSGISCAQIFFSSLDTKYVYRSVPRKCSFSCKCPPPIFDDSMVRVYKYYFYTLYIQMHLSVSDHPNFWRVNSKYPLALTRTLWYYKLTAPNLSVIKNALKEKDSIFTVCEKKLTILNSGNLNRSGLNHGRLILTLRTFARTFTFAPLTC